MPHLPIGLQILTSDLLTPGHYSFDKFALQSTKFTSSYSFDCCGEWQVITCFCWLDGLTSLSINVFHELDP